MRQYPLTPLQAGLLSHHLRGRGSGIDIEQLVCILPESVDVVVLRRAWMVVALRHDMLRTAFRWEDVPEPVQEVHPLTELPLVELDWRCHTPEDQRKRLQRFLGEDRQIGFDLAAPPLFRLALIRTGDNASELIWTFHHILLDGRAFPLVLREVFAQYDSMGRGEALVLAESPPFREYVAWLSGQDWTRSEPFWRSSLAGFSAPTPLPVPFAPGMTGRESGAAGEHLVTLDEDITRRLHLLAKEHGLSLGTLVQGAWALLLSRYSRESEVVFGVTRTCRRSSVPGAENMVGLLINTVPLRVQVGGDEPLVAWLKEIRDRWRALRDHEHTPLRLIQAWSEMPPGTPLFDTLVVYEEYLLDDALRSTGPAWKDRRFQLHEKGSYPLTLAAYGGDSLTLKLEYDPEKVTDVLAARLLGHMQVLLANMPGHRDRPVGDLAMLSAAEERRLLDRPQQGEPAGATEACLHQRFGAQVARTPDAVALVGEAGAHTYRELDRLANRLAHRLVRAGVGPDVLVGLCAERSPALVVGILGILKAGGAYVPLDPSYPAERLEFMLGDAAISVLVTQREALRALPATPATVLLLDDLAAPALGTGDDDPPDTGVEPRHLAYVIYTSGSTGQPKGVLIAHQNVGRLLDETAPWFGFDANDVWTLFHSFAFDFSVWEIWGSLLFGGRLVVVSHEVSRSPEAFLALLIRERVTVLNQTPSAFRQLMRVVDDSAQRSLALRWVVFGGEALEPVGLRSWFERFGDQRPRLVNMYGITETTVHVTYRPLGWEDVRTGAGSVIGVPIPDLSVYLLDPGGRLVPDGVPGEIHVGGAGVARGYLNRPELTAQRFVPDRFGGSAGGRLYRSGDLARRGESGELEYLGRIDHQVKLRGFRIELGEIEAALVTHPDVPEAVVVCREDTPGEKRLVAYHTGHGAGVDPADLRAHLQRSLPEYMVPGAFVGLPAFPLTGNGKVDLRALPIPEPPAATAARPHVAPRTPREAMLAQIWADVLRLGRVGVLDNYYELGGDSILSIRIASRARQAGMPITVGMLVKHPTIAQLASAVGETPDAARSDDSPATGSAPLTAIQRWFFELDPVARDHWNQSFLFQTAEDLEERALRGAIDELLLHHDGLRLRFHRDAGGWRQQFAAPDDDTPLWIEDFSGVEDAVLTTELAHLTAKAATSLRIEAGPCLRAVYVRFGPGRGGRLLLVVHHLVVDGVSWSILLEDLERSYRRLCLGLSPSLPARTTSYQRWADLLTSHAATASLDREMSHWQDTSRAPLRPLPVTATGDPANTIAESTTLLVSLDPQETGDLLQRVPAAYGTQVNDVLLTALQEAMAGWIGGGACLIDLEGHGREEITKGVDLSRTVGWFTSIFPVRLELDGPGHIGERLAAMKEHLRAVPNHGIGYGVLRYLAGRGELASRPQSQLLFNYLGQLDQLVADSSLFKFATEDEGAWRSPEGRRPYLLEVNAMVLRGRLEFRWTFSRNIHDHATIGRVASSMADALRGLIRHCLQGGAGSSTPSDFPLIRLSQPEVDRLAGDRNVESIAPLAPMQALFLAIAGAGTDLGFEQWSYELEGAVVPEFLREAWQRVTQRHAILRTGFARRGALTPVQVIRRYAETPFTVLDLRDLPEEERIVRLRDFQQADRRKGFDIEAAPLQRVALFRTGATAWRLVWSNHHLILDRWSWPIVLREVGEVYRALEAGKPVELAPPVPWLRYLEWLQARDGAATERFWRAQLQGMVPAGFPRLAGADEAGGERTAILDPGDTARLAAVAREQRITLNTLVALVWAVWIARKTGTSDVVFGLAVAGRSEEVAGIDDLVGMCINNIPLRVGLNPSESVANLLERLGQLQSAVREHEHASPADLQDWSGLPSYQRLFDTLLVFQESGADLQASQWLGDAIRVRMAPVTTQTNYPLTLVVGGGDALRLSLVYQGRFANAKTAGQSLEELQQLLVRLPTRLGQPVQALLDAIPPADRPNRPEGGSPPAIAPRTDVEWVIAHVWEELLGHTAIGVDHDFFDLGGNSLVATQLAARVRDGFGVEVSAALLFDHPTVASFAAALARRESTPGTVERIAGTIRRVEEMSSEEVREAMRHG